MAQSMMFYFTILAFLLTIVFVMWRPRGMNEAIPAAIGGTLVLISGSVSFLDLWHIASIVSGAAITIIATIVIAIILESIGFFSWASEGLAARARGSGIRLFWYVNLLSLLMTLFFNNDGSILITTPILLLMLDRLKLTFRQKIPYLLSGALFATSSSAAIGVSNIVNLISLKLFGMDLYMQFIMMFVPTIIGLALLSVLLFGYFYRELPREIPTQVNSIVHDTSSPLSKVENPVKFMRNILLFVFTIRISLFIASYLEIPIELVAGLGSVSLLGWRWLHLKIPPADLLRKTPWHIFGFAFGMYVIVYGLHNIGLTSWLIQYLQPVIAKDLFSANLAMGGGLTLLSTLFNNHPALMIGTLSLTQMELDPLYLQMAYLASVIGSDIGALLLPMGTLASLIWLHLLKKAGIRVGWKQYMKVSFIVIPITSIVTLILLYFWNFWVLGYARG